MLRAWPTAATTSSPISPGFPWSSCATRTGPCAVSTTSAAIARGRSPPATAAARESVAGEALYYFLWPNTMLYILPGRLQTNRVIPLAPQRCRVEFDYYYPASEDAAELARREQDHVFSDEVQAEDIAICEQVQRGLASGAYVAGRRNPKRESGVHHFQELLREAIAKELARGG